MLKFNLKSKNYSNSQIASHDVKLIYTKNPQINKSLFSRFGRTITNICNVFKKLTVSQKSNKFQMETISEKDFAKESCISFPKNELEKIDKNSLGYKEITYHGDYENKITGEKYKDAVFFYKVNDVHKYERIHYRPIRQLDSNQNLKGGSKYVSRMDGSHVFLELHSPEKSPPFNTDCNNHDDLVGTSTIKAGIAVDVDKMITPYGGSNLIDCVKNNNFMHPAYFQNALGDLTTLHKRDTFLADIKMNNCGFNGKNVTFFDVEDRIRAGSVTNLDSVRTPEYITPKLWDAVKLNSADEIGEKRHYLKTADEYAFLLTIIYSTVSNILTKEDWSGIQKNDWGKSDKPGAMNDTNKSMFLNWIRNYVQPAFHSHIENMLRDPYEYAKTSTTQPYLSEMLDVQTEVTRF
ncbi:hypothetical protein [Candidatus Hamiltonella defensa]|uniref:hypothetical protein n=1 Tax=Candidatus Williamhamiltonella defendens TaxID=138072 RepID=UPI0015836E69|nr:hypothetical protein [Candidatus Hamiltonella defensa]